MTCGVYLIRHLVSSRVYVGSSIDVKRRWATHRAELRQGRHHSGYLQNSWTKHGEDAFEFVLVEKCAEDDLATREQYWMDTLSACEVDYGYNIQPTARTARGYRHTPEALEKIRVAARRRSSDPAHKKLLSERASRQWAEGRINPGAMTEERRRNSSLGQLNSPSRFDKYTPEVRAGMSAKAQARWKKETKL